MIYFCKDHKHIFVLNRILKICDSMNYLTRYTVHKMHRRELAAGILLFPK